MSATHHIDADHITLELLQSYYNIPLAELAKEFGISLTLLKKICRKFGIQRWPHRQIRSINRSSEELKVRIAAASTPENRAELQAQLNLLEKKRRLVTRGASSGLQSALRNAIFLANPEQLDEDSTFESPQQLRNDANSQNVPTARKINMTDIPQRFGNSNTLLVNSDLLPPSANLCCQPNLSSSASMYSRPEFPQRSNLHTNTHNNNQMLLQHQQISFQLAQLAMSQQLQMNNYMYVPPLQHVAQPVMPTLPIQSQLPLLSNSNLSLSHFAELASLLDIPDEEIAIRNMEYIPMESDYNFSKFNANPNDFDFNMPPQTLPEHMQTGNMNIFSGSNSAYYPLQPYMNSSNWPV